MSRSFFSFILALFMTVAIVGCENRVTPANSSSGASSSSSPTPTSSVANNVLHQWLGKWIGPEGTFLVLAKNGSKYVVEIHSLDGAATYEGTSAGDRIEFQRGGKTESIHAGSGQETGMKWLLDKKNCLIIQQEKDSAGTSRSCAHEHFIVIIPRCDPIVISTGSRAFLY
jgi:hypothetical protein